jgi:probable HAF family extracellular repeat protein
MRKYIAPRIAWAAAAALATTLISAMAWSAPPSFQGVGHLPGSDRSQAHGVSSDGSVVVGYVRSGDNYEAFRWTSTSGMQELGSLPGFSGSYAYGVSGDGSIVVGGSRLGDLAQAFRWTSADGMQSLGGFPTEIYGPASGNPSAGIAISADGSTIVSAKGPDAFRWTSAGGLERLSFPSGVKYSSANAISPDGSVFVGSFSSGKNGAYRWTSDRGFEDLNLTGGEFNPSAYAVSADGSVVVGFDGSYAFRWTDEGTQVLGDPRFYSAASGVSGDGSTLVGFSEDLGAFIWDETLGMRSLQQVLVNDYDLNLTGWTLQSATAISADGRTIVGYGTHLGRTEAWIATIPEPSSLALMGLGGIVVFLLRRCCKRPGYGIDE